MEMTLSGTAHPAKAAEISLDARMPAAQALHAIVDNALQHLHASEPAAAAANVEGVHQLRVAVRRLRASLALFDELLEPQTALRFGTELRRLGRVFGHARDWDVFCTETLPRADRHGSLGVPALLAAAAPAREAAHVALRAELASPALPRLLDGIAQWVDPRPGEAGAVGEEHRQRRLGKVAPRLLARLERKVDRRARHLARLDTEELHALRKALKKLRYGAEFLDGVYGRKATRPFRHRSRGVLKLLGAFNDAAASVRLATSLDAGEHPELAAPAGALAAWAEHRSASARDALPRAWRKLHGMERPWA